MPADVTVSAKRFSFNYSGAVLTTGDYVQISRQLAALNRTELVDGQRIQTGLGGMSMESAGFVCMAIYRRPLRVKASALDLVTPSVVQSE